MVAVQEEQLQVLEWLAESIISTATGGLNEGRAALAAAVRAVDMDGQTSVIYACHFNKLKALQWLIANGAAEDLVVPDWSGYVRLHFIAAGKLRIP